ncbi:MAG: cysteine rich repeat-containing protein, partial [Acidobacteriota bacterium]
ELILSLAVLAMLLLPGTTLAQEGDDLIEQALEICQPDIEAYCSQVTPGEGRLLACFVAHEDKISGACEWAVYEVMDALNDYVDAIAYLADACWDDLVEFCGDVEMGEGRVGTCLLEHSEAVSDECSQAMDDVELEIVDE